MKSSSSSLLSTLCHVKLTDERLFERRSGGIGPLLSPNFIHEFADILNTPTRMTGYAEVILILDLPLLPACRLFTQNVPGASGTTTFVSISRSWTWSPPT